MQPYELPDTTLSKAEANLKNAFRLGLHTIFTASPASGAVLGVARYPVMLFLSAVNTTTS